MSYTVQPCWALVTSDGDWGDVFSFEEDARAEFTLQKTKTPHTPYVGVEKGYFVADGHGHVADGTEDFYWEEHEAERLANNLNTDPGTHLHVMRRTGGLRLEAAAIIKKSYPIGIRLKIESLDVSDEDLRESLTGKTVTLTRINEDGSFDVTADHELWEHNRDFGIPFGKAVYQKVRP